MAYWLWLQIFLPWESFVSFLWPFWKSWSQESAILPGFPLRILRAGMEDFLHPRGHLHSFPCASKQRGSHWTSGYPSKWQQKLVCAETRSGKESHSLPLFTSLQGHCMGVRERGSSLLISPAGVWWEENQAAKPLTWFSAYTQIKHAHIGPCASTSLSLL